MNTIYALLSVALLSSVPTSSPEPIQVLVLGTFHMGAAGGPMNPTVSDLLGERRQAELDQLAASLADFDPTHVMVEADHDADVIARMRATGAIFLAKTNCPELGIVGTTEPRWRGPTHNPWDVTRSPGAAAAAPQRWWPRASCPWAMAEMGGAPSAFQRRPAVCSA